MAALADEAQPVPPLDVPAQVDRPEMEIDSSPTQSIGESDVQGEHRPDRQDVQGDILKTWDFSSLVRVCLATTEFSGRTVMVIFRGKIGVVYASYMLIFLLHLPVCTLRRGC